MEMRGIVSEFIGMIFLIILVVGSGIMGEKLAAGNTTFALLANEIATGVGLFVLISKFGPISDTHFNPAVNIATSFTNTFAGIRQFKEKV